MHLSASKSVHFNAQEPTYAFSECDGGGDECSDDEYVFSCAFSDSLMKKCLKKKKEEEEEKKRREERRKREEEERKRKEEEEKKKKEEEKKREAARRQEEAKKERQRQLDAVKTRFTTQLNELQKKSELLEQDATKRLSALSARLTTLSKQCADATSGAKKKKEALMEMLRTKKRQFRRNLRIRESERFCCVNGSLQLFEALKPSPMKLRCVSSWREKRAKTEETVSLAVERSHKRCDVRVCFGHSASTSELEFSRFFAHFTFPPPAESSLHLVSSPRDADLFVRLHVVRSAQQEDCCDEEGAIGGPHRIECVVCPAWLVSSVRTKNAVILGSVDEVKPFVSKWREMMEEVVKEKEAGSAGVAMNEWLWSVVSLYLDWKWNCVDEEEFVRRVFREVADAMKEQGMSGEARTVEEAGRRVRSLGDVRLLSGSKWDINIPFEKLRAVEKRIATVDLGSLKKERMKQEEVTTNPNPSLLELDFRREVELSKALEKTMMENVTEPDLASLMDSIEIDACSVLY